MKKINFNSKLRKKRKIRAYIQGTKKRPRIAMFRSNKYTYAQAIDDEASVTLGSFSTFNLAKKNKELKKPKKDMAKDAGVELGKILKSKKINEAVFDRSAYGYKGRVKEFCEGLREAGIKI